MSAEREGKPMMSLFDAAETLREVARELDHRVDLGLYHAKPATTGEGVAVEWQFYNSVEQRWDRITEAEYNCYHPRRPEIYRALCVAPGAQ